MDLRTKGIRVYGSPHRWELRVVCRNKLIITMNTDLEHSQLQRETVQTFNVHIKEEGEL